MNTLVWLESKLPNWRLHISGSNQLLLFKTWLPSSDSSSDDNNDSSSSVKSPVRSVVSPSDKSGKTVRVFFERLH